MRIEAPVGHHSVPTKVCLMISVLVNSMQSMMKMVL